jgi:hypothetical protein
LGLNIVKAGVAGVFAGFFRDAPEKNSYDALKIAIDNQ